MIPTGIAIQWNSLAMCLNDLQSYLQSMDVSHHHIRIKSKPDTNEKYKVQFQNIKNIFK